ncbi:MAG: RadC family protein [Bacillota bacterium]
MAGTKYKFTIKEMPEEERPREKLMKYGADKLSNSELLALIIRTGHKEKTAIRLARDILSFAGGIEQLNDLSVEELKNIKGVGIAKGTQIQALIELSKRFTAASGQSQVKIKSPQDVCKLVMPELRYASQEIFKVILLNIKNQVIAIPEISKGSLNKSMAHPRDVFRVAIRRSSAAIVLVHNHPSGDPEPSKKDIKITKKLAASGDLLGIEVLDHLVIGDGNFVSMKEKQLF